LKVFFAYTRIIIIHGVIIINTLGHFETHVPSRRSNYAHIDVVSSQILTVCVCRETNIWVTKTLKSDQNEIAKKRNL